MGTEGFTRKITAIMNAMKKLAYLFSAVLVLCLVAPSYETNAQDRGIVTEVSNCPGPRAKPSVRPKVVGGWQAELKHWPGQVTLRLYNPERSEAVYFCSGSVISPHWVLTAAHCKKDLDLRKDGAGLYYQDLDVFGVDFHGRGYLQAVLQTDDLKQVNPAEVRNVTDIVVETRYQGVIKGYDIALLRLAQPWDGPYARLALNASADPVTPPGATVMASGFGNLKWGAKLKTFIDQSGGAFAAGSSTLQEVDLPIIGSNTCQATYPYAVVGDGQLCAGHEVMIKDSCQGDSGGQLVAFDKNGCPYQIGIVSWGEECARPGRYGVYTRVSHFAQWIRDNVPKTEALLTVKESDLIDWTESNRIKELAYVNLAELEKLMAPVSGHASVQFRRKGDDTTVAGNKVRLGERYVLDIRSEATGRLIVIDVDAAGKVTQIFPNKFVATDDARLIRAGEIVTVPGPGYGFDWFRAKLPVGSGKLLVFVVPEDFPVEKTVASEVRLAKGFEPERAVTYYLMSLTTQVYDVLRQRYRGVASVDHWAIRSADYEIVN